MINKPKVVLDTNVYLSAIIFGGKPREILSLAVNHDIKVFISPAILLEISEKLYKKFSWRENHIKLTIKTISKIVTLIKPKIKLDLVKEDPTDNKILECSSQAKANHIITGDKHLLKLKRYKEIQVITPADFLQIFTTQ